MLQGYEGRDSSKRAHPSQSRAAQLYTRLRRRQIGVSALLRDAV
jgi:hypothetical protein